MAFTYIGLEMDLGFDMKIHTLTQYLVFLLPTEDEFQLNTLQLKEICSIM